MGRVLLVGRGPLPHADQTHTGFAQLRTHHFHAALVAAGHTVDLHLIEDDHVAGQLQDARRRAQAVDVVVSAGPHRPAALAAQVAGDRPLWIDLPGDPLAELQALVQAPGPTIPAERITAVHGLVHAVLSRADHLSVISEPQRHATFGPLALLGRPDVPVAEVPIAYDFPVPSRPPRPIPSSGPVVLALSGAFAPWFDDITLARALELALVEEPRLRVVATGGGVEGHYTAGYTRFSSWARQTPVRDRIRLHGWLPHHRVPEVLGETHVGLCLDRPGPEPTLGSRTRVLLFARLGLHIAASPETTLVAELADQHLATPLPTGRAEAVARALVGLVRTPPSVEQARAAQAHLSCRYAPSVITKPLVDFVASPARVPPGSDPTAAVAAENEALRAELAAVHQSPTWRTLSHVHRLLRRFGSS